MIRVCLRNVRRTDVPPPVSVSYVCTNHDMLGEVSSVRDEKEDAVVPGAEVYKDDVLFQM